MARFELLNPNAHSKLRLLPPPDTGAHFTQIVSSEFTTAATSCPIMLTKDPETGNFFAGVVLSLKPGEAPLKSVEERGGFQPLSLQCNGFYISDEHIAVDLDNPRFSEAEGDLLFTETQQPADSLRQVQVALGKFQTGIETTKAFIAALTEHKLIEAIDMSLNFDSGERIALKNLYTVSMDKLHELEDGAIIQLFRAGHLELAYTVAASLKQFGVLAHLRNQHVKG